MSDTDQPTGVLQLIDGFSPKLVSLTEDVLYGDVWKRADLNPRDRSLITIAALIAGGNTEPLRVHLGYGRENGLTEAEIIEAITHLAFYAGWPKAMLAILAAKQAF